MVNNLNFSNQLSDKLILVAEDNEINFKLLNFILRRMNYKVIRALNGKEAVDIFSSNPEVDLILTDLSMPLMDGIEATRKIRELDKHVPIIVQTGFTEQSKNEKAIEAGCNSFLTKPVSKDVLLSKIKECLNSVSAKPQQYKYCG
jgi:CheY-like chemotaxis protein